MPRRSSGGRSRSPVSRVPARAPPAQPPATQVQQPKQPGLFGQMAATAGGVAIGSTVGHMVGHALTGGGSAPAEQAPSDQQSPQQYQNPCGQQMQAFLDCAQKNSGDLSICYGFNEALKECKMNYGMQQ